MLRLYTITAILASLFLFTASTRAGDAEPSPADLVHPSLLADADCVVPGRSFMLGVRLQVAPHWHTYWVNPGESGNVTKIQWHAPVGFEFGPIQWPLPTKYTIDGGVVYGYEKDVMLLVPVKAPTKIGTETVKIEADVSWLTCKAEACVEGQKKLELLLLPGADAKPANVELFNTWKQRLAIAKEQAIAGGLSSLEQKSDGGTPVPVIEASWKEPPRNVQWFPVSTDAATVENVVVTTTGNGARITFKPKIFKAEAVPGGRIDSVLVYEDSVGRRIGVNFSVIVAPAK